MNITPNHNLTNQYQAEVDNKKNGLEQKYFDTEAQAIAYVDEECKWENTISGIVRGPNNGTVLYMNQGDFYE